MIAWFRTWSKGIIIAIIISTIMEMILPENTSKKYIKIIIGLFIVYTIVSPIINEFTGTNIDEYIEIENYIQANSNTIKSEEISQNTNDAIKKIYIQNLQNDLKTKLKEKGYIVGNISINLYNDESYNIEKIDIKITEKIVINQNEKQTATIIDNVKSVKIKIENNNTQTNEIINENDKSEIKNFVKNTYDIGINKINVS